MRRSARTTPMPCRPFHLCSGSTYARISGSLRVQCSRMRQATVTFLHLSMRLPGWTGKAVFFCKSKRRFHLVKQVPVIIFEGQGIVAVLLDNLFGNLDLFTHRINGDNP